MNIAIIKPTTILNNPATQGSANSVSSTAAGTVNPLGVSPWAERSQSGVGTTASNITATTITESVNAGTTKPDRGGHTSEKFKNPSFLIDESWTVEYTTDTSQPRGGAFGLAYYDDVGDLKVLARPNIGDSAIETEFWIQAYGITQEIVTIDPDLPIDITVVGDVRVSITITVIQDSVTISNSTYNNPSITFTASTDYSYITFAASYTTSLLITEFASSIVLASIGYRTLVDTVIVNTGDNPWEFVSGVDVPFGATIEMEAECVGVGDWTSLGTADLLVYSDTPIRAFGNYGIELEQKLSF
jgi:hypothetical protein